MNGNHTYVNLGRAHFPIVDIHTLCVAMPDITDFFSLKKYELFMTRYILLKKTVHLIPRVFQMWELISPSRKRNFSIGKISTLSEIRHALSTSLAFYLLELLTALALRFFPSFSHSLYLSLPLFLAWQGNAYSIERETDLKIKTVAT